MPLAHDHPVPSLPEGIAWIVIQDILQAPLVGIIDPAKVEGGEDIGYREGSAGMSHLCLRDVIHRPISNLGGDVFQAKLLSNLFENSSLFLHLNPTLRKIPDCFMVLAGY